MLTAKRTMTEASLAAHRANAHKSHGAATGEGKERARAANLRHGFYSRNTRQALEALGERPEDLAELIVATREQFSPATTFEERMVEGLAIAWLRMERAGRVQESLAVRRLEWSQGRTRAAIGQGTAALMRMTRPLEVLEEYVGREAFYTPQPLLEAVRQGFEDNLEGMAEEIFILMHRLRRPPRAASGSTTGDAAADPFDVLASEAAADEDWETKEWLEDHDAPIPRPEIPVAEGTERQELRERLQKLVAAEIQALCAAREEERAEHGDGLSAFERDEVIAATGGPEAFLRRQEESCFRRVMRLGTFLTKLQDQRRRAQSEDGTRRGDGATSEYDPAPDHPTRPGPRTRLGPPPPALSPRSPRRSSQPVAASLTRRRNARRAAAGSPTRPLITHRQPKAESGQRITLPPEIPLRPAGNFRLGTTPRPEARRASSSLVTCHSSLRF